MRCKKLGKRLPGQPSLCVHFRTKAILHRIALENILAHFVKPNLNFVPPAFGPIGLPFTKPQRVIVAGIPGRRKP